MGLISIPFSSPPAGLVSVVFAETGLQSPAEEPSLSEQAKDSLEDAQPITQAPSENVCLCHISTMLAFKGCSLDHPGRAPAFIQS